MWQESGIDMGAKQQGKLKSIRAVQSGDSASLGDGIDLRSVSELTSSKLGFGLEHQSYPVPVTRVLDTETEAEVQQLVVEKGSPRACKLLRFPTYSHAQTLRTMFIAARLNLDTIC